MTQIQISPKTRQAATDARNHLGEAKDQISHHDRDPATHNLDEAEKSLSEDNDHGGLDRVMKAKHDTQLAKGAIDGLDWVDAEKYANSADRELEDLLSEKMAKKRTETARQESRDLPSASGGDELRAAKEEQKNREQAGEQPKPEQPCISCDSTSPSGEWMEGARQIGPKKR